MKRFDRFYLELFATVLFIAALSYFGPFLKKVFEPAPIPKLGEECSEECADPFICIRNICRTKRKIGDACDKLHHCDDTSTCMKDHKQNYVWRCYPKRKLNESCERTANCEKDLWCNVQVWSMKDSKCELP